MNEATDHLLFNLIGLSEADASQRIANSYPDTDADVVSRLDDDNENALAYVYTNIGIEFGTWFDLGVDNVNLYAHCDEFKSFPGPLPLGLNWKMGSAECHALLGKPCGVYRPGKKEIAFEPATDTYEIGEYLLYLIYNDDLSELAKLCSVRSDRYPAPNQLHHLKTSIAQFFARLTGRS